MTGRPVPSMSRRGSADAAPQSGHHDQEQKRGTADIQDVLDKQTEGWGIKVSTVELKRIDLDESMVRAIARQAEAERERRAKIINAEGEQQAAQKLVEAATHPRRRAAGDAAALSRHAVRYRERTRLHDRVSVPDRARARLRRDGAAELTSARTMILAHSRASRKSRTATSKVPALAGTSWK